ncbi:MAG: restriction endonuclease subunit S [Rhodococcus sp.]|nr:restriction endonuclease subunit S [Rhodococcus sp. (in: high G+C Gram-positive bacteria)]
MTPLKFVAEVFPSNVDKHSREGETPVSLCNYTDVYYNDTISDSLEFMKATATREQIERFSLRAGDTIITKDSESADDIGLSTYVPEALDGVVCGYHLSMIRPNSRLSGRFVKRLFDSHYVKAVLETNANGLTRVGLGQYALDNIDIPLPPVQTQVAIADFIDRETAKIDALIAKQEQLIAALLEDRAATITQAVTNGLDPDVEMKDSGSIGLGFIPSDWTISRLKMLLVEPLTYGANAAADDATVGHPRYVRITDIGQNGSLRKDTFRSLPPEVAAPYLLEEGDLLFARSGATVGKTFMYEDSWGICCYAGYLIRARFNQTKVIPSYMNYFAATAPYWYHIASAQIQATIQNVSAERYGELVVPVPPLEVQHAIVENLNISCAKIDALTSKSAKAIEILREYRSALITDAVTGKIDVREAA